MASLLFLVHKIYANMHCHSIDQFLEVGSKCPICNKIIDKTKKNRYLRIYLSDIDSSGSSKAVVRSELKKSLTESNHKIIALQTELSNTKAKLDEARANHETALIQARTSKDTVKEITETMQSLKMDCQQVADARDDYMMKLKSVKLCNQTLIDELKESQKSYNSINKELNSLRSKKEKCSTCEKKPLNSIGVVEAVTSTNSSSNSQDYRSKYLDLQKQNNDLLEKKKILEKKFVELTISANSSNVAQEITYHAPQHHQQGNGTHSRENKLLIDISRLKKSKDKMYKEKCNFQGKYNATNIQLKEMQANKEALLGEIKALKEKLKASDESVALLEQAKQDWQDDTSSTKERLKTSLENVILLKNLNQKYAAEIVVVHSKLAASEQMMQAFQENELVVSKELDELKSMLESANISNNDLSSEIVTLKEKLATATRSWF